MIGIAYQVSHDSGSSLSELCEQFHKHALFVRGVEDDTVIEEILYLRLFFHYLGSADASSELFGKITPERLRAFLTNYAQTHPPGSRRWMQLSLRSFLRFAYHKSYLKRDLSPLIPAVRKFRMGHLPQSLPDTCIALLNIKNPRPFPCASYLSGILRRHIKRLGIDLPENVSYGTHGFRHAFASRLISHVPFKELVDMLGHRRLLGGALHR